MVRVTLPTFAQKWKLLRTTLGDPSTSLHLLKMGMNPKNLTVVNSITPITPPMRKVAKIMKMWLTLNLYMNIKSPLFQGTSEKHKLLHFHSSLGFL